MQPSRLAPDRRDAAPGAAAMTHADASRQARPPEPRRPPASAPRDGLPAEPPAPPLGELVRPTCSARPRPMPPSDAALRAAVAACLREHGIVLAATPGQWAQLVWQQEERVVTSESSVRLQRTPPPAPTAALHREVRRALGRMHCLQLLLRAADPAGAARAHRRFVAAQPPAEALRPATFARLGTLLQGMSAAARQVLEASAVACKSARADAAVRRAQPSLAPSPDSELWLAEVAAACPEALPAWAEMLPAARALLPAAYPPATHLRHMLYTEGGDAMFAGLRRRAAAGQLSDAALQLWLGRWLINIAAFRAHEDLRGGAYLTEPVARAVLGLVDELRRLPSAPQHDVLGAYLTARAAPLELRAGAGRPYLTHLACMLRLATAAEAAQLQAWFDGLAPPRQVQVASAYAEFRHNAAVTPTYEPALLANLRAAGCGIGDAAALHAAIMAHAWAAFARAAAARRVAPSVPLCLRALGEATTLARLLAPLGGEPGRLETGHLRFDAFAAQLTRLEVGADGVCALPA